MPTRERKIVLSMHWKLFIILLINNSNFNFDCNLNFFAMQPWTHRLWYELNYFLHLSYTESSFFQWNIYMYMKIILSFFQTSSQQTYKLTYVTKISVLNRLFRDSFYTIWKLKSNNSLGDLKEQANVLSNKWYFEIDMWPVLIDHLPK